MSAFKTDAVDAALSPRFMSLPVQYIKLKFAWPGILPFDCVLTKLALYAQKPV